MEPEKPVGSPRTWDACSYHRVSGPMEAMGRRVLDRLPLRGDETVLDAGCGTGRVTAALLDRLPRGRVIAVDADTGMLEAARQALGGGYGDRVELRHADLLDLDLDAEVDAVLSTAAFHWVLDHDRLFANLLRALRPGGRLVAQCGGAGNIARVLAAAEAVAQSGPWSRRFERWSRPNLFATAEETEARLWAAGFVEVRCWLEPAPALPEDPLAYLATITCGAHLDRLDGDEKDRHAFVAAVRKRLPDPLTVDYVRLNIDASRG